VKKGAARCSSNNWYQSLKVRGGSDRLHATWMMRREVEVVSYVMSIEASCTVVRCRLEKMAVAATSTMGRTFPVVPAVRPQHGEAPARWFG
jgi:hypothetical protein